ncbi:uncharacterized protein PV09_08416 [Verruconis gallopava]|uniref:Methyltransferase domain-containing protein n=1 Tax=Verruconis gallopava TaxID=253628 RepID=A0A0D2ALT8_9PEZI|nr:uncharacterized protein PV09_08416 [Verruconis gallopava]KIW00074.1 hypothetical protein PV09_08416 [Verruconis gallopava]
MGAKGRMYGSDHAKLNITLPPQTMWMNMGYWKNTEDFPSACRALLEEVLKTAQLMNNDSVSNSQSTFSVVDLGFGCGDQTLYFEDVLRMQKDNGDSAQFSRRLNAYVGITLDAQQFRIAQSRLRSDSYVKIHCGDASKVDAWSEELREDLRSACQTNRKEGHENWLLALDTLYHFKPAKWPVIEYAKRDLDASFMAYDLCIADNLSLWHRLIIRFMAFLGHSPFINWVTVEEYRERLVEIGYAREKIEIRDISEHVFRPLARFMRRRESALEFYGISIGRFRHGIAMFDWWGRSQFVKGCIIVARK